MKTILLIGANFKNKGAEAMAYTALVELYHRYPNSNFYIASYARDEALPYCEHPIPGGQHATWTLVRSPRSAGRAIVLLLSKVPKIGRFFLQKNSYLHLFSRSDLVIDLSGFALSSQRKLLRQIVYAVEVTTARWLGVPFVAMTQAMGPFESPISRVIGGYCLRHMSLVIARGDHSRNYIHSLYPSIGGKLIQCADSAYLFPAGARDAIDQFIPASVEGRPRVGVVPNVNIYRLAKVGPTENPYIIALIKLLEHLVEVANAEVLLICHESYPSEIDDDWIAKEIVRRFPKPERLHHVPANLSASNLKAVLGAVEFVVASRFHSVVAAASLGVPFLAVGWSHKYDELVEAIGLEHAVCDGRGRTGADLIEQFERSWSRRAHNRKVLSNQINYLKASAASAFDEIEVRWPEGGGFPVKRRV